MPFIDNILQKEIQYMLGKVLLCALVSLGLILASCHEISGPSTGSLRIKYTLLQLKTNY